MTDDSRVTIKLPPLRLTSVAPLPELVTPTQTIDEERRPMAPHLSYSQLSMYLRCSMQYYFRYVVGLKDPPKVSLSIGKGGHAALEWNTKFKLNSGEDHAADEVVQKASDMMDFYMSEMPPSEYEKDVEPGQLKDKQLAATQIYMLRDAPAVKPIGAEIEHNLDINKYLPETVAERLRGPVRPINLKIDHLYADGKTRFVGFEGMTAVGIEDYKYVTRKKTQTEANISPQLTTYAAALKDLTGNWPTKVGLRMMHPGSMAKKPKPDDPVPDSIPLLREPEHMTPEALTRRLVRLATQYARAEEGIRAGIFIPVDDPITCSWCGFRTRCQDSLVDDFEAAKLRQLTLDPAA